MGNISQLRRFFDVSTRARLLKYVADLTLWTVATPIAFFLRQGTLNHESWNQIATYLLISTPVRLALLMISRLERRSWRRATVQDLLVLGVVVGAGTVAGLATGEWLYTVGGFPRTAPLIAGTVALIFMGGARLALRIAWEESKREIDAERRVLLVGAGEAGARIATQLRRSTETGLFPVGFLDDDPAKAKMRFGGVPVLGATDDLARVVHRHGVEEVLITMPSATGEQTRSIVEAARAVRVPCRILPGLGELLTGGVDAATFRRIEVEDLLRRDPVRLDEAGLSAYLQHRVVLITGAGGSIGSELVRQAARLRPGRLILLGQGENSLHEAEQMLQRLFPGTDHQVVVGNVTDRRKVEEVFAAFRPDVVFHAAAYKHVPMLEYNPDEAIINNVGGTRIVAEAARDAGVARFVNISTDKAVNPVSFLGYTKLLAEEVVRHIAATLDGDRSFVSVRFGNVLGSRGSVIPIFERQIAAGGPVTVTDAAMTRFFMTIPEASQLVLQAGALADNGAVYVLDMGRPVRIHDLATDLIRLSGKDPERIPIIITGRRPGEKVHEELFTADEHPEPTANAKILVAGHNEQVSPELIGDIEVLIAAAEARDWDVMDLRMRGLFPDYAAPDSWLSIQPRRRSTRPGPPVGSPPPDRARPGEA